MSLLRASLNIVLHQVRSPDNLGAVARLMRNFGFDQLTLSDPATTELRSAEKMARRGADLLDRLQITPSLDQALAECVYACGTTSREEIERRATVDPETAIARLLEHAARGKVALVFGGEKRGLSDEELSRCQDICVIPTEPAPQPSMNLAQAAAVMLYLCSRAARVAPPAAPEPEGARLQTTQAMERLLKDVLLRVGFLNPQQPEYILEELMQSLHRGRLRQREVELWLAALKAVDRVARK